MISTATFLFHRLPLLTSIVFPSASFSSTQKPNGSRIFRFLGRCNKQRTHNVGLLLLDCLCTSINRAVPDKSQLLYLKIKEPELDLNTSFVKRLIHSKSGIKTPGTDQVQRQHSQTQNSESEAERPTAGFEHIIYIIYPGPDTSQVKDQNTWNWPTSTSTLTNTDFWIWKTMGWIWTHHSSRAWYTASEGLKQGELARSNININNHRLLNLKLKDPGMDLNTSSQRLANPEH